MFDDDSDKDKRKQSLLSLGASAPDPFGARGYGSILTASTATANENDPALRHRLARSRREAEPSPLLSALAAMEGFRAEPAGETAPPVGQPSAAEPKKSRWSFRDLLSPKLKIGQPDTKAPVTTAPDARPERSTRSDRPAKPVAARAAGMPVQPARPEPSPEVPETDEPGIDEQEFEEPGIEQGGFQAAMGSPDDPRWRPLIDPLRSLASKRRLRAGPG